MQHLLWKVQGKGVTWCWWDVGSDGPCSTGGWRRWHGADGEG